jgi:hypothetical protein
MVVLLSDFAPGESLPNLACEANQERFAEVRDR